MIFFSSELVVILKKDHGKIRELLTDVIDQKLPADLREEAFNRLTIAIETHSKMEEEVVYNFVSTIPELKHLAVVGTEEHHLIDRAILELKSARFGESWDTKALVLNELIERHLTVEEDKLFPAINKRLDDETDYKLRDQYVGLVDPLMKIPAIEKNTLVY